MVGHFAKLGAILLAALMAAALLASCGGSGSSSTTVNTSFVGSKGENLLVDYGKEMPEAEREAANEVLEESMKARAAGEWQGWCDTLTTRLIMDSENEAPIIHLERDCAKVRAAESAGVPPSTFANTMTEPIGALRREGSLIRAVYHGAHGKVYVIPMKKEGGEWKVDEYSPLELR